MFFHPCRGLYMAIRKPFPSPTEDYFPPPTRQYSPLTQPFWLYFYPLLLLFYPLSFNFLFIVCFPSNFPFFPVSPPPHMKPVDIPIIHPCLPKHLYFNKISITKHAFDSKRISSFTGYLKRKNSRQAVLFSEILKKARENIDVVYRRKKLFLQNIFVNYSEVKILLKFPDVLVIFFALKDTCPTVPYW